MKEETKSKIKDEWIMIFIASFVSLAANYFFNYSRTGNTINIIGIDFWWNTIIPLCVSVLISIAIIYLIVFSVDKIVNR